MGSFSDLIRRRSPSRSPPKRPEDYSTLDVPLPAAPRPLWAAATEPELRRPGPRAPRGTYVPPGSSQGALHGNQAVDEVGRLAGGVGRMDLGSGSGPPTPRKDAQGTTAAPSGDGRRRASPPEHVYPPCPPEYSQEQYAPPQPLSGSGSSGAQLRPSVQGRNAVPNPPVVPPCPQPVPQAGASYTPTRRALPTYVHHQSSSPLYFSPGYGAVRMPEPQHYTLPSSSSDLPFPSPASHPFHPPPPSHSHSSSPYAPQNIYGSSYPPPPSPSPSPPRSPDRLPIFPSPAEFAASTSAASSPGRRSQPPPRRPPLPGAFSSPAPAVPARPPSSPASKGGGKERAPRCARAQAQAQPSPSASSASYSPSHLTLSSSSSSSLSSPSSEEDDDLPDPAKVLRSPPSGSRKAQETPKKGKAAAGKKASAPTPASAKRQPERERNAASPSPSPSPAPPPSPSKSPLKQVRCAATTSSNVRCRRLVTAAGIPRRSPSPGEDADAKGEGAEEDDDEEEMMMFCKQHAKSAMGETGFFLRRSGAGSGGGGELIRYEDWIPSTLPLATQATLRGLMGRAVSEKDCPGYIYLNELLPSSSSLSSRQSSSHAPPGHTLLKLGRTLRPAQRLKQWRSSCPSLEPFTREIYPLLPSPSSSSVRGGAAVGGAQQSITLRFAPSGTRNHHRWERLCLVELAGRARLHQGDGKEGRCGDCGKRHQECFVVPREAVSGEWGPPLMGGAGEREEAWEVREVVERWERWCRDML